MKTLLSRCVLASCLLLFGINSVSVQAQVQQRPGAPVPAGTSVAVIDIGEVFKKHNRFLAQMEDVKKDIEEFDAYLRQERKRLENMAERLKELRVGSNEYRAEETKFANQQADLQVRVQLKKKEIMEREARVRYDAYREIVDQVSRFAVRHGIQLVVRFNSQPIDPDQPQSVQLGLNRAIIYQNSLNITEYIITDLNRGQAPAAVGNRPQIPQRRR